MTHTTDPYRPELLPGPVSTYLHAHHHADDVEATAATFAADARVTDEGAEYRGTDEIRRWLTTAASEYTYTTTLVGQVEHGQDTWTVLAHLEGDFPGGVADLRLRFRVGADGIDDLVIAP